MTRTTLPKSFIRQFTKDWNKYRKMVIKNTTKKKRENMYLVPVSENYNKEQIMELLDLMKRIGNNDIPHFLIFFGEEQKIIDIYIQNILQSTDGKKVVVDNVSQAIKDNGKKSLDKSIKIYVGTAMIFIKQRTKYDVCTIHSGFCFFGNL